MKNLYTLLITTLLAGGIHAQFTQSNHAPANGDTYSMWDCGTSANPGAAGSGATWNFSSLTTNSSVVQNYTATTATDPNYPNANVTVSSATNNTMHYKSGTGSLLYYGGNIAVGTSVQGTISYTNPAVMAVYPMSLGTTSTSATNGTVHVVLPMSVDGSFTGSSRVHADGTGTLILPGGGSYTNATRVLTSQTINITAGSPPIVITATVFQESYAYYTPGIKAPVVSVVTATSHVTGSGPSTQTIVSRNTNAPGVITGTPASVGSIDKPAFTVSLFPNPAGDQFTLSSNSGETLSIGVFDINGRKVYATEFSGEASISTAELASGLYLYSITGRAGEVKTSGKLAVMH